jgi:DNA-binding NarL/FixJ family response regulator
LLICDARSDTSQALVRLLTPASGTTRIRLVTDGPGLIQAFTARPADLVLVGVHRSAPTGADVTGLLLARHPAAVVIAYGAAQDTDLLITAVTAGASGLMLFDHPPAEPDHHSGSPCTAPERPPPRHPETTTPVPLTDRERLVLHGMSHGRSNQEIGRLLLLSEDTVKSHGRRLFRKLGAADRAHAVALGFRQGLLLNS